MGIMDITIVFDKLPIGNNRRIRSAQFHPILPNTYPARKQAK